MRRLILTFAALAPLLLVFLWMRHMLLAGIAVLALSHALILIPTLLPNVQWLGPVVTRFSGEAKEVWLTIDDGPAEDTPALLDALDARSVKATFFLKGELSAAHPERVAAILGRGHSVGNHSYTHPSGSFWCLGPRAVAAQIDRCAAVIPTTPWFRAPVGMKNPFVHPHLARRGLRLIGWTVRGFDATRNDEDAVVLRIVPRVKAGAIVVMHQGRVWSVRTVSRVVDELLGRGYTFVVPDDSRLKTNR
jgi:peptidoglycan/xylan/chitin deacetylase (PgdA/CDA1 family)